MKITCDSNAVRHIVFLFVKRWSGQFVFEKKILEKLRTNTFMKSSVLWWFVVPFPYHFCYFWRPFKVWGIRFQWIWHLLHFFHFDDFWFLHFSILYWFLIDFGVHLNTLWRPNSIKYCNFSTQKSASKSASFFNGFGVVLASILKVFLVRFSHVVCMCENHKSWRQYNGFAWFFKVWGDRFRWFSHYCFVSFSTALFESILVWFLIDFGVHCVSKVDAFAYIFLHICSPF